ncbi:amidohydrolase family protein [Hymenobacter sp. GOD-10R]|uniref:amidohydrolase family protein n=1 Tax=Hymenobacter sp. GOD-10R TaxID=3093922 RepID=UPI002D77CF0D|nr:amidohydrolase family protein [Hymenobacter sp. GOD-10R]WRQ31844.1 amidohydrolase family protein [Hymenobacter sp. GOD-10R]
MCTASFSRLLLRLAFLALTTGCGRLPAPGTVSSRGGATTHPVVAITHVNVIPLTAGGHVLPNVTVLIRNDRIAALNGPLPAGTKRIDGRGKWLMPGLIDMHVHVPTDTHFGPPSPTHAATLFLHTQDIMTPYVANGVTTIVDLNSRAEHFGQRNEIARGDVIGPRLALAALINGGEGPGRIATTAADGRQAVRSAKAEGYELIKVYSQLNSETFQAIVDEADKQGLRTIGHIPNAFRGKLAHAFVPHFGMVAHAEEFSKQATAFSDQEAQQFAQLARANGTWLSPTLTTSHQILRQTRSLDELRASSELQYVHPLFQSKWLTANNYNRNTSPERIAYWEKLVSFHVRLVQAFRAAGVPLVVGTDTGTSGVIAGFAVHDELEFLAAAGLTAEEVLAAATRLPAAWLGLGQEIGTIEVGKRADLVLLTANPLDDVRNTRAIAGVFVNGRWLKRPTLDAMLAKLSKRYTAMKGHYDWQQTSGR